MVAEADYHFVDPAKATAGATAAAADPAPALSKEKDKDRAKDKEKKEKEKEKKEKPVSRAHSVDIPRIPPRSHVSSAYQILFGHAMDRSARTRSSLIKAPPLSRPRHHQIRLRNLRGEGLFVFYLSVFNPHIDVRFV